jgi:flagellin-like hook-associated protein FlgL
LNSYPTADALEHQAEGLVSIVDGLICIRNGRDAGYALESARLPRSMLLQETSTSLLAKSNGLNEVVLDLLKDK